MSEPCHYIKNNCESGLEEKLDMLLAKEIGDNEKRLWIKVIFRAVLDLDNEEEELLRDDDEELCKDQNDQKIRYKIKETAFKFLSGQDSALKTICEALGVNSDRIIRDLVKLGPLEFKRIFIQNLTRKINHDTIKL